MVTRRHVAVFVAGVVLSTVGCSPSGVAATPAATTTAGVAPLGSSPSLAPTAPGAPYPIVRLPQNAVRSVALPAPVQQIHRMRGYGQRVIFDEIGYTGPTGAFGRRIWIADLAAGSMSTVTTAADGFAAWLPDLSGDNAVWVEWRYSDASGMKGTLAWRVMAERLDGNTTPFQIASGTNRRLFAGQAQPPVARVSGDTVAYTAEDPDAGRPNSWDIVLYSLSRRTVEWAIVTDHSIYSLDLSDGAVVYSEGTVDPAVGFTYDMHLMLATASHPEPTEVAQHAFDVALNGERLAWVDDRGSDANKTGSWVAPRIFTATLSSPTPVALSAVPDRVHDNGGSWPTVGDDSVAWTDDQDVGPAVPVGDHLVLWRAQVGHACQIEPTAGMILSHVGQGWLTWYNDWGNQPYHLYGIPLSRIPGCS